MTQEWYYTRGDRKVGPVSGAELKKAAAAGKLSAGDLVWRDGMPEWRPASSVKGLFPPTSSSPPPVPAAPPRALVVRPADPPAASTVPAGDDPPGMKGRWRGFPFWKKGLVAVGLMLPVFGGVRGCLQAGGAGVGTITFAERIDPKTLKTTNESVRFTQGWVHLLVRSKRPFGDTKVIVSSRAHDEQMWAVVNEVTTDAKWDMFTVPLRLDDPGKYDVKATTSTGKLVAQATVEIVAK